MRRIIDNTRHQGIRIRLLIVVIIALAVLFSALLLQAASTTHSHYDRLQETTRQYMACERAAYELQDASNYLTTQVRMFAITHDTQYIQRFFTEAVLTQRRESALDTLHRFLSEDTEAYRCLEDAMGISNTLVDLEYYSMKLIVEALDIPTDDNMIALNDVELDPADAALSQEEMLRLGQKLVTDESYQNHKDQLYQDVSRCIGELSAATQQAEDESNTAMTRLLKRQQVYTVLLLITVLLAIASVIFLILVPLSGYTSRIMEHKTLTLTGAYELQYLAKAYNRIFEENQQNTAHLKYAAEHDPLTGLFNRGAFEKLYEELTENVALLHIDIDYFRDFNNNYGHDMGDAVLKKVSGLLNKAFRSSDFPFRTGGDEFVVIMTAMTPELREAVRSKIEIVRAGLRDVSDGMPPITLSIGVAFSGQKSETGDLYKDADVALYWVKEAGRNGFAFYDETGKTYR